MTEGLPDLFTMGLKGVLWDLDGVITHTASVHAVAWKQLFDAFLQERADRTGELFVPFTIEEDYPRHVDGKPRYDGVRTFLASRGITLPDGTDDDGPDEQTVCGLGNKKNGYFVKVLEEKGADVFPTSVELVKRLKVLGIKHAINSSSKNCRLILRNTGLIDMFDAIVDGVLAAEEKIPGKPAPDTFVRAAELLGLERADCAVVEDAVVGVQSGRAGNFRLVIGVDRGAGRDTLLAEGADVVVTDMREFLP